MKAESERSLYMNSKFLEPYDKARIEIIALRNTDVIATSYVNGDDMDDDGWTTVWN
jgi:hypothetical protein